MKADELMIGDWVRPVIPYVIHCKINSFERLCFLDEEEIDIEPIPITPEILMKNGFTTEPFIYGTRYFCNYNESIIRAVKRDSMDYAYVYEIESNKPCVPLLRCTHIKYVHELQHALKLCGIEKEIEL